MEPTFDPMTLHTCFADPPQLHTPRLVLRRLTMRDARDMYAYAQDPEVARHVLWDAHRSLGDTRRSLRGTLREYRAGEPSSWGIVLKETGQLIGTCGFMACSYPDASLQVGYSLGRQWWGMGLMTEALTAVTDFAFHRLGIHRLYARYETDNPASGRVLEKCGFTPQGVLRGAVYNKGRFSDVAVCGILRRDWQKRGENNRV